jgi:DNA polymerase I-like protein with 3'-5' exonuclease and polymerase domains
VRSALFAAAFAIQAANMRAASNHQIQSTGAQITKNVERKIWDIQPAGSGVWCVKPMNIHDEVMTVTIPKYVAQVHNVVDDTVESFRSTIPLIKMEWCNKLNTWADK